MGCQACMGATIKCSFGMIPSSLMILPTNRTITTLPAANIMDNKPFLNILPFGMCQSLANPMVAAATAAAFGVLTPMPCIPCIVAPWIPGGKICCMIGNMPALNNSGKCMCNWGGMIEILAPGQFKVQD